MPFPYTNLDDLKSLNSENTLYVIGNGFDLFHGAKSGYTDFSQWLGKEDPKFKNRFERYFGTGELWSDFEENLGCINESQIINVFFNSMWKERVFLPFERSKQIDRAISNLTRPVRKILNELYPLLEEWTASLTINDNSKPLEEYIKKDSMFLDFNFTEFLETIYDVNQEKILYIHGCRNKSERLIIGHSFQNSAQGEATFISPPLSTRFARDKMEEGIIKLNFDLEGIRYDTAKKTENIIEDKYDFFRSTRSVKDIIVLGHSLSKVDLPYFERIMYSNDNRYDIHWHISFHSLSGVKRIVDFCEELHLEPRMIDIFNM